MYEQQSNIREDFSAFSDDQLLPARKVAEILDITEGTLANWACKGNYELAVTSVGRLRKYRVADIRAYLSRNRKGGEVE